MDYSLQIDNLISCLQFQNSVLLVILVVGIVCVVCYILYQLINKSF